MAVTYRYLTAEQQRTTAEQEAFAAEHNYLRAVIDLAADPASPEKQAAVAALDTRVNVAQAKVVELGGVLPDPQVADGRVIPG